MKLTFDTVTNAFVYKVIFESLLIVFKNDLKALYVDFFTEPNCFRNTGMQVLN